MDRSLKPDPNLKGSYYRRIADIGLALQKLGIEHLPPATQFLTYYFGCEKLARAIVGIHQRLPAVDAYHRHKHVSLTDLELGVSALNLSVSTDDLCWLFANETQQHLVPTSAPAHKVSARVVRNLIHDLGPTNVDIIEKHGAFYVPKMQSLLRCVAQVHKYQVDHFSSIQ